MLFSSIFDPGRDRMAELTADVRAQERSGSFFAWMAALCVFYAFAGFSTTYFIPMAEGTLRHD